MHLISFQAILAFASGMEEDKKDPQARNQWHIAKHELIFLLGCAPCEESFIIVDYGCSASVVTTNPWGWNLGIFLREHSSCRSLKGVLYMLV